MPPRSRPESPWRSVLHLLWLPPVGAVAFALFFGTLNGATRASYVSSYVTAVFFGYPIGFCMWALEHFVFPRLDMSDGGGHPRLVLRFSLYAVASLVGVFTGVLAMRLTVAPHLFGSVAQLATIGMFTLLFTALFVGIAMASIYYRKALARAGTERELQLARRIQRSFLISEFPRRPRVEVHAENLSSKEVSGDFYDVVPAGDAVVFVIADVSGKGVPAALLSSMLQGLVRVQAGPTASPAAAMRQLNTLACQRESTGQFATLFLAWIHEPTLTLRYTNAGHNPPVLMRGSERRLLDKGGVVLGLSPETTYDEDAVTLAPGDRLVLYTDGVTEAANTRGEMLGEEGLYACLDRLPADLEARAIVDRVLQGVREFLGTNDAGDDITVMALRVLSETGMSAPIQVPLRSPG